MRAQDVTNVYTLGRVLGRGQFGTTRLAVHKASGKEYACKSIGKRKLLCAPPALAHHGRLCGFLITEQPVRACHGRGCCLCGRVCKACPCALCG